jgi:hypothetical protein
MQGPQQVEPFVGVQQFFVAKLLHPLPVHQQVPAAAVVLGTNRLSNESPNLPSFRIDPPSLQAVCSTTPKLYLVNSIVKVTLRE